MSEHLFLRNEMLWGREAQEKLARSHVIVFGLGGVGSYTAECLARSGVGELTIVDNDTVSSLTATVSWKHLPPHWAKTRPMPLQPACWTSILI
jgi:tRNA A37 threonylcarbamoyladenosine dehydratase